MKRLRSVRVCKAQDVNRRDAVRKMECRPRRLIAVAYSGKLTLPRSP